VASFFGFAEPFTPVPLMTHRQFARAILPLFGEGVAEQSTKIPPRVMALVKRIPKSVVRNIKRIRIMPQEILGRGGDIVPSWFVKEMPKDWQKRALRRARYVRRVPFMRLYRGGMGEATVKTPFHEAGHELEAALLRDKRMKDLVWRLFKDDPRAVAAFQKATSVRMYNPHEVLAETAARRIFKKAGWERFGWPYEEAPEWAKWAVEEAIKRAGGVP